MTTVESQLIRDGSVPSHLLVLQQVCSKEVAEQGHMDGPLCVLVCDALERCVWSDEMIASRMRGTPEEMAELVSQAVTRISGSSSDPKAPSADTAITDAPVLSLLACVAFFRRVMVHVSKAITHSADNVQYGEEQGGQEKEQVGEELAIGGSSDEYGGLLVPQPVAHVLNEQVCRRGRAPDSPVHGLLLLLLKLMRQPPMDPPMCLTTPALQARCSHPVVVANLPALQHLDFGVPPEAKLAFDPFISDNGVLEAARERVQRALVYVGGSLHSVGVPATVDGSPHPLLWLHACVCACAPVLCVCAGVSSSLHLAGERKLVAMMILMRC